MVRRIVWFIFVLIFIGVSIGCSGNQQSVEKDTTVNNISHTNSLSKSEMISVDNINNAISQASNESSEGIKAVFLKNKKGTIFGFVIHGHSGYAEKGADIVCAAVSALAYNAVGGIQRFTNDKNEWKDSDGYMKCYLPDLANGNGSKESIVILKSFIASMEDIVAQYGQYVKVSYMEVR